MGFRAVCRQTDKVVIGAALRMATLMPTPIYITNDGNNVADPANIQDVVTVAFANSNFVSISNSSNDVMDGTNPQDVVTLNQLTNGVLNVGLNNGDFAGSVVILGSLSSDNGNLVSDGAGNLIANTYTVPSGLATIDNTGNVEGNTFSTGGAPGITQNITVLTALPSTFKTLNFLSGLLIGIT